MFQPQNKQAEKLFSFASKKHPTVSIAKMSSDLLRKWKDFPLSLQHILKTPTAKVNIKEK